MIQLTRLNGQAFALNADLIERVDVTPDTVVTLVDGTKYLVSESVEELLDRVVGFRAGVIARAQHVEVDGPMPRNALRVVRGGDQD